jgi:hypothetical protein
MAEVATMKNPTGPERYKQAFDEVEGMTNQGDRMAFLIVLDGAGDVHLTCAAPESDPDACRFGKKLTKIFQQYLALYYAQEGRQAPVTDQDRRRKPPKA